MSKAQSVTSVGQSPDEERRDRMKKYLISQIVRVICIILAVFVQGWAMWIFFAGAIFLPYFAVVLANAAMALMVTGKYPQYQDALEAARKSLQSGAAKNALDILIQLQ